MVIFCLPNSTKCLSFSKFYLAFGYFHLFLFRFEEYLIDQSIKVK
jgi:hypothetical protein